DVALGADVKLVERQHAILEWRQRQVVLLAGLVVRLVIEDLVDVRRNKRLERLELRGRRAGTDKRDAKIDRLTQGLAVFAHVADVGEHLVEVILSMDTLVALRRPRVDRKLDR